MGKKKGVSVKLKDQSWGGPDLECWVETPISFPPFLGLPTPNNLCLRRKPESPLWFQFSILFQEERKPGAGELF